MMISWDQGEKRIEVNAETNGLSHKRRAKLEQSFWNEWRKSSSQQKTQTIAKGDSRGDEQSGI